MGRFPCLSLMRDGDVVETIVKWMRLGRDDRVEETVPQ